MKNKSDDMKTEFITPETVVYDLLEKHPGLEDKLIELAPVFKKLKNPVLRKTIARVTTLKQASVVGGVPLGELINKLRFEAGQKTSTTIEEETDNSQSEIPEWISNVSIIYDAREDLENGVHPINKVMNEVAVLKPGEVYLMITPFIPAPLIDILQKKGIQAYSEMISQTEVKNYFTKLNQQNTTVEA